MDREARITFVACLVVDGIPATSHEEAREIATAIVDDMDQFNLKPPSGR